MADSQLDEGAAAHVGLHGRLQPRAMSLGDFGSLWMRGPGCKFGQEPQLVSESYTLAKEFGVRFRATASGQHANVSPPRTRPPDAFAHWRAQAGKVPVAVSYQVLLWRARGL